MDRRTFVKRTVKALESGVDIPTIEVKPWFDCPYTVVDITFFDWINEDGEYLTGRGCAKVCHPDTWETEVGQKYATVRAIQNAAKRMLNSEHDYWKPTY